MRAAEMLKRLEKARRLIAILPANTDILTVLIDGVGRYPDDLSNIHLATGEWDRLIAANVLGPERPILPHDEEYDKISILTGGFDLFELIDKDKGGGPHESGPYRLRGGVSVYAENL